MVCVDSSFSTLIIDDDPKTCQLCSELYPFYDDKLSMSIHYLADLHLLQIHREEGCPGLTSNKNRKQNWPKNCTKWWYFVEECLCTWWRQALWNEFISRYKQGTMSWNLIIGAMTWLVHHVAWSSSIWNAYYTFWRDLLALFFSSIFCLVRIPHPCLCQSRCYKLCTLLI